MTDKSDTPRTDDAADEIGALDYSDKGSVVPIDFARQLERENKRLREALENVMVGGNHLAALIGNHPPYTTSNEEAMKHYLPHHPKMYEAWCCWKTIMEARAELEGK